MRPRSIPFLAPVLTVLGVSAALAQEPVPSPSAPAAESRSALAEPATPSDRWLAGFQSTYIWQKKPSMPVAYTPPTGPTSESVQGQPNNSLQPGAETGYTLSATFFLGVRPWQHTEILVNPEIIQAINISDLHGLGGMSNSENQKGGKEIPTLYMARAFVRQTIPLGGDSTAVESSPNQFATTVTARRLVLTAGMMSLLDVFDVNPYMHDGRTQFINWALLTHGAFDFAADTRGYTWGIAAELYRDDWILRLGRYLVPKESNGMALDFNFLAHYGDNLEIVHQHVLHGLPGSVRLLAFRNWESMGAFEDAIAAKAPGAVPTVANVRHNQSKVGVGLSLEQAFDRDGGFFVRGSWNDGRTETYSFAEIERSVSAGVSMRGGLWRRAADSVGAAWVMNGISTAHQRYLATGGLGFIIGDGQLLHYRPEQILEVYYTAATFQRLWLGGDYQLIANPAYNADRGPVSFLGIRLHLEI
jgi:high affinity Mn2+ porin